MKFTSASALSILALAPAVLGYSVPIQPSSGGEVTTDDTVPGQYPLLCVAVASGTF